MEVNVLDLFLSTVNLLDLEHDSGSLRENRNSFAVTKKI